MEILNLCESITETNIGVQLIGYPQNYQNYPKITDLTLDRPSDITMRAMWGNHR